MSWPRITIVTPSFNQGRYLEATICSVLEQGYPNLEYFVVDGGSTDESVEVIRRYEKHVDWWVSEKDRGQSHAINKGFSRATGEVANWLCSDDQLCPGALKRVAELIGDCHVVAGQTRVIYQDDVTKPPRDRGPCEGEVQRLPYVHSIEQPSCFFRRRLLREVPVREELHYTMDLELWLYFLKGNTRWRVTDDVLSIYRMWSQNKTSVGGENAWKERVLLAKEYCPEDGALWTWAERVQYPLARRSVTSGNALERAVSRGLAKVGAKGMRLFFGNKGKQVDRSIRWLSSQAAASQ